MVFESKHPLVKHKLALLRSVETPPKLFRELVTEISLFLCYECCADLPTESIKVTTPMGDTIQKKLSAQIGIVPILRAGLGMVDPMWDMIPSAKVLHIGMYRNEETLEPVYYYDKLDEITNDIDVAFLLDPMLATGGSAIAAADRLKKWGVKNIKFVCLIAAPEGIEAFQKVHPDVAIHVAEIDSHLNDIGYIVPGLGDAGDRQFGTQ